MQSTSELAMTPALEQAIRSRIRELRVDLAERRRLRPSLASTVPVETRADELNRVLTQAGLQEEKE